MKKWIISIAVIIIGIVAYNYLYQDHRDISSEMPEFVITSDEIGAEFIADQQESETKYLNKTISIKGKVTESSTDDFTLDSKVFCQLKESLNSPLKTNSTTTVKGRVIGYDELLEQVKLDQCSIQQ